MKEYPDKVINEFKFEFIKFLAMKMDREVTLRSPTIKHNANILLDQMIRHTEEFFDGLKRD